MVQGPAQAVELAEPVVLAEPLGDDGDGTRSVVKLGAHD
jgi:hypothetical protein